MPTSSRREFLKLTGAGTAAFAASGLIGTDGHAQQQTAAEQAAETEDGFLSGGGAPEGVTTQTIAEAEKLHALDYTEIERELILKTVKAQVEAAKNIRMLEMPNDGPAPALVFTPRLPQTRTPTRAVFRRATETVPSLPDNEADITFAPVTNLAHWIETGQITSRRLTELYLDRIDRHNDRLECMITVTRDLALAEADAADAEIAAGQYRGPLHGIPYGAKDLLDTKDIRTTWGAMPYKDRVAKKDATVVTKLRDAGAVLIGKTSLGALAYDDLWWGGRTRNPWNPEEGSSGSSAGSGSAVAAGLMGFAIGTETLGSIASPSTRNGTVGLRPTFGRVSRHGAMALCWSLDKIGPMCRSVEDAAIVLDAINGYDPREAATTDVPYAFDGGAPTRGAKLGYVAQWFEDDSLSGNGQKMLDAAEKAGMKLVEIELPEWPYNAMIPILTVEAAAAMEELTLSGRDDLMRLQTGEAWPNEFRQSRLVSAVDHVQMNRFRRQVMEMMHEKMEGVDAIFGPSLSTPMLLITNYTGHPQLTIRAGFIKSKARRTGIGDDAFFDDPVSGKEYDVPVALSLWGPLYADGRICELGMALEKTLGVQNRRPPLFA